MGRYSSISRVGRDGKQAINPLRKWRLVVGAGEVWGSYSMGFSYTERVETEVERMVSAKADLLVFPTRHQTDLTNTKIYLSQVSRKYFPVIVRLALLTYLRISEDSTLLQKVNRITWKTHANPPLSDNFSQKKFVIFHCLYKKIASLKRDAPTSQGHISSCLSIFLLNIRHLKTRWGHSFLEKELNWSTPPFSFLWVLWETGLLKPQCHYFNNLHLLPLGIKFFLVPNPILPCSDLGWSWSPLLENRTLCGLHFPKTPSCTKGVLRQLIRR